jgi:LysM repeat protein
MDNNDSNIKPQQTGGLKLMTVFIAVLALHVVVIGGFAVYHLMSGGSPDADLVTTDKTHKALKGVDGTAVADAASSNPSQGDKNAPGAQTATSPTDVGSIPAIPAPASDQVASAEVTASTPAPASSPAPALAPAAAEVPALAPAPVLTLTAPKPVTLTPPAVVTEQGAQTPSGPIAPELAPPPEPAPVSQAPIASGPVHMPPPAASAPAHDHEQIYVVKITDSYKKIALAHHITVAQLKEANNIKTDVLHTGQKLIIPSGKTEVAEHAPRANAPSATQTTAINTSLTKSVLSEPAPATSLAAAPASTATGASQHHTYTVVKGDTLTKIAHKFKTTKSALMAANNITDPAKLSIGEKLKIPSKASSTQESRSARISTPAPSTPATPSVTPQPSQVQAKEKQDTSNGELATFVP